MSHCRTSGSAPLLTSTPAILFPFTMHLSKCPFPALKRKSPAKSLSRISQSRNLPSPSLWITTPIRDNGRRWWKKDRESQRRQCKLVRLQRVGIQIRIRSNSIKMVYVSYHRPFSGSGPANEVFFLTLMATFFICMFVCSFLHPFPLRHVPNQLTRPSHPVLRASQLVISRYLTILHEFVSYWGRCPGFSPEDKDNFPTKTGQGNCWPFDSFWWLVRALLNRNWPAALHS